MFDKLYLIKSISAVTNYNSSSCYNLYTYILIINKFLSYLFSLSKTLNMKMTIFIILCLIICFGVKNFESYQTFINNKLSKLETPKNKLSLARRFWQKISIHRRYDMLIKVKFSLLHNAAFAPNAIKHNFFTWGLLLFCWQETLQDLETVYSDFGYLSLFFLIRNAFQFLEGVETVEIFQTRVKVKR